ncbi:putative DYW domain-containing protein [Rosa chinensis]|uniref:Putative DYW domain-containing protein n=1 Tax=Rosa chinensis TaxID=74649 RepID=A0A2P6S7W3_ROSCH|nr:putative DYW domain-containing protein [Rosa chinensis]
MKGRGYKPQTKVVLDDLDEEEKERMVLGHSEKLSVAFGLTNTKNGETIRISKNLRQYEDCHYVTKFISKFTNKEILVRDVNRFHPFRDGVCSCGDYWKVQTIILSFLLEIILCTDGASNPTLIKQS